MASITDLLSSLPGSAVWLIGSALLFTSLVAASLYTCLLVRGVAKRRWRIALFLPVLVFLTVLPNALFSRDTHILGVGTAACVASWWAAHKSLSFLLNYRTAPSADAGARALFTFCTVIILPVRLSHAKGSGQGVLAPAGRALGYLSVLAVVGAKLLPFVARAQWPLQPLYRGLIIFGTSAFISDLCAALAESVGVHTEQAFRQPWLAASLGEFWTKRWNLPASDVLRDSVYYPVVDMLATYGAFGAPQGLQRIVSADDRRAAMVAIPAAARIVASFLTFFISGVMHELVIFCLTGSITGEMILFFSLHGVMVIAETVLAMVIRYKVGRPIWREVPVVLRRMATIALVLCTGHWLFFEPMVRSAIDIKAGQNIFALYESMVRAPKTLEYLRSFTSLH